MLIFKNASGYHIFIHIPKNGGKYIRKKLRTDKKNKMLKSYWGQGSNLDLAHIPYVLKSTFIDKNIDYNYFTYTRNPYDRFISAFFYKNSKKEINDLKNFIKNELMLCDFNMEFNMRIIHYYPQYLFVCDENLIVPKKIQILKLELVENPKKYDLHTYLDNECISIINKVYSEDFKLFDYEPIVGLSV